MISLRHARGRFETRGCAVMGIVNRTPDSFYDGGRMDLAATIDFALRLVDDGAEILDIGGVRAGPGPYVSPEDESARLVPVVEALASATTVPLSVETARPAVARAALAAGAAIVNDVSALAAPELAALCAEAGAALVCMHHGGQVRGRPLNPRYEDVVAAVVSDWARTISVARSAGVDDDALVVDPGLDFGKTTYHSLELMRRLDELVAFGFPVLIAPSRKDVVGETLDLPPDERLEGTLALVALSVSGGAAIVRVHDVAASVRVVHMVEAVRGERSPARPVRGLRE